VDHDKDGIGMAAAAEFICQVKNTHVHIKCKR